MRHLLKYKQHKNFRWCVLTALVLALLFIGHLEGFIKEEFTSLLTKSTVLIELQLGRFSEPSYSGKFVNLIYRLLYFSVCLAFIQVYFMQATISRWILRSYVFLLSVTLLLYGIADKLNIEQLRIVAFRIDSLIVSPLPIAILIPAFLLLKHK